MQVAGNGYPQKSEISISESSASIATMRPLILLPCLVIAAQTLVIASNAPSYFNARTVYHGDGTYTESQQDLTTRTQKETTYNAQKVVVARKEYLLNTAGQPVHGNIYDGRGSLKARAQFLFDEFGRMSEQRMLNLSGEVYQQLTFSYDRTGKAQPPKVVNYNVSQPDMKPATIDFTQQQGSGQARGSLDRSQGNVPYLASDALPGAMGQATPSAAPQQPVQPLEKKPGFFGRIFAKDKEKK
jgi:hypothetical protein